ncbi:hypothetical protein MNB_SM-7-481 [hydrothermal vent metagenome]|uniref:DUF2249 domain-containing protein n=1 Tax=hydrothermal vent metagenome TaxID=652676 RepID=A0A1W1BUH0_9ZZZZ
MNTLPQNAQETQVEGSTVPFYTYEENGVTYLYFDSSKTGHPEPMVNAMSGLKALKDTQKLVMINHKPPMGLFPKIEADYSYEVEELDNGLFKITFTKKADAAGATNYNDTACNG